MLGTAAAALIGLLFVATSLHLDEIMKNSVYRIRARNNSFYLLMLLLEATLIPIPQPMAILGAELIIPLEISSRSANVKAKRERRRGGGRIPPQGETWRWSQPVDATLASNLSAGISNPKILRGRSLS
jgi:hypothetical protein